MTELRKKQESDVSKEQSMSVSGATPLTEKGSAPLSLSAPAINTGGRDAISLGASVVPVSSSALDLIKKKLQDSTAPATSIQHQASAGAMPSELNGSIPVDVVGKGSHSENGKDKVKDDNADGNLSNSSSDSEDVDSGPTKEECAIQFKVSFILLVILIVKTNMFLICFCSSRTCIPDVSMFLCHYLLTILIPDYI